MRRDWGVGGVHPARGGAGPGEEGGGGGGGRHNHRHGGVLLLPSWVQLALQVLDKAVGKTTEPGEDDTGYEDRCDNGENVGGDHHICDLCQWVGEEGGRPRRLLGAKRQQGRLGRR